jgi:hypothetical protein
MNTENADTSVAPQWAVVELMGHNRYGGMVSKDNQFGTSMLRVDVPQADGSFVSQLINPQSLYRITMCSEEIARAAAKLGQSRPMDQWELRHLVPTPSLVAPIAPDPDHEEDDEGDEADRY